MDILEWIDRESSIDDDILSSADIGTSQKVISIAMFWMANPDKSIRRIEEWQISHTLPYRDGLSDDTCYSLMKDLEQDISAFQKHIWFDYNKDGNCLTTVKMLTLFCLNDHQPITFSRQPGNIPDVISVLNAFKQLSVLRMDRPLLALDGGFFSEDNILAFVHSHTKFLMRGRLDGRWIFPELQAISPQIEKPFNAQQDSPDMYCMTRRVRHQFTYERQRTRDGVAKGSITVEGHHLYLHFILNIGKTGFDTAVLMKEIQHVEQQLVPSYSIKKPSNHLVSSVASSKTWKNNYIYKLVCSHAEAFGRVIVEAMLGGLPVIGNDVGRTSELISDSVNGFLFKNRDSTDLANKIEHFVNNKSQIEKTGRVGHIYAYENFLTERCATGINNEYVRISNC